MSLPEHTTFIQYLEAKKTVDDQSLNRSVWNALTQNLENRESPLRVLEVGAGIGTMIARVIDWGLFDSEVFYTAVDLQSENIIKAPHYLKKWADSQSINIVSPTPSTMQFDTDNGTLHAAFHADDVFSYVANEVEPASVDLLIAHAFIDLVHIPTALPALCSVLKPGGLFYLPITFDGITAFEPPIEPALDAQIERLYHGDMEKRRWQDQSTGGSQSGRRLLRYILNSPFDLVAAGASDWVVTPQADGHHRDEAIFLHSIIDTIDSALRDHPELNSEQFTDWIKQRHQQIDEGVLIYIAHQLDILGKV